MKIQVEVISEEITKPSSPTPPQFRHYQLSSLDQLSFPIYNHLLLFYSNKISEAQLEQLKLSVSNVLTHFYPLAGRIKDNYVEHNSFVDCNDEGVVFKEARVIKCQLSDFLRNPVPEELRKLFPVALHDAAELPMGIQFNTFACGGIGIGLCISHKIGDALSFFTFLNTWAAIARGDKGNIVLPKFVSAELFPPHLNSSLPQTPVGEIDQSNIATRRLMFSASKIEEIRAKYGENGSNFGNRNRLSRIEALSAFIWSRFVASTKAKSSPRSFHTIIHTVNLRTRFEPPLPQQSFGNIFRIAITVPSMDGEKEYCYANVASQIRDSIRKIDEEYVRKLQLGEDLSASIDEGGKSFYKGETMPFIFTSLCKFPVYEADFGWGKPIWVCCGGLACKNGVVFIDSASGDGIEAWVDLTEEDMAAFESDDQLLAVATF